MPRHVLKQLALAAALAAGALLAPLAARADVVRTENSEAELIAESSAVEPGAQLWVGLRLKIREHWHTYWRNPGDSGVPATLEWTLPTGFKAGEIAWPAPHRLPSGPLLNYGYDGEVLLPVPVTVPAGIAAGTPVPIAVEADWLVCEKICIPEHASLSLTLPAGPAKADPRWASAFAAARAAMPVPSPWPARFAAGPDSFTLQVAAPNLARDRLEDVWFYADDPNAVEHAAAQKLAVDAAGLTLTIPRGADKAKAYAALAGVLVVRERLDGRTAQQAFEVSATPGAVVAPAAAAAGMAGVIEAVLLALVGGLILNLMPCVFPVLSMKALGFAQHARGAPGELRRQGWAFAGGVLMSFAALAGALIALRAGGAQIGWGFQLQSPVFVAVLAYVVFALGLSLSGVFTIGNSVMGVGGDLAAKPGLAGSFFTGVLAVVVATPCTAPFMGAAVGFALTQPWYVSLAVFEALGIGLALPYLALSLFPALLRFLPRPGAWMERFKQLLAFPMYATAAWLVWVVGRQAGLDGVAVVLGGLVLVAFAAWLYDLSQGAGRGWRLTGVAGALGAVVVALLLADMPAGAAPTEASPKGAASADAGPVWEKFSPQRLAELRAQNKPVFVNLTAAWCITCMVNDKVALAHRDVAERFAAKDVAYLKGDWTNQDPEITRLLASHGRSGVPLYLLYPKAGEAVVLPQILTKAQVLDDIAKL